MELESGQEVLASDLEQQQAVLVVSNELVESESAGLVNNIDTQNVSGGELTGDAQYVNADLGELIGDDGPADKLTKVFDASLKDQGDPDYGGLDDETGKRKSAKSDLKRESIEEKKQLQKEEQKIEKRAVIKFLTLRGKSGAKIHRQLKEVYGDQAPSLRNVNFWRLQFLKGGRLRLRNAEKCGRRATATTQENIESARSYIEMNPHAKISEVGKEIGVSHGTAFRILHEHLKLQNFGGKWIPANLKLDNQLQNAASGAETMMFTDFEAAAEAGGEHYVYAPVSAHRRIGGSHAHLLSSQQRSTLLGASASSQRGGARALGSRPGASQTQRINMAKQPVSVVTVHPRSRRAGGTVSAAAARRAAVSGEYVKSEMDDMNAMVTNYFEMDEQQAGDEVQQDGESGNVVMGMAPDGSLYVVTTDGDGTEQDGYVVQETTGYVVEETNYISYPETSM